METQKKVQRIRIVEIERSWTTLHKMLIGMILVTFLAVICPSAWVRTICSLLLLAVLIFSFRKLHDLRHHGMTVIVERPDELTDESPLAQAALPQTAADGTQSSAKADAKPDKNWFEQPYADPDAELFTETETNTKGE